MNITISCILVLLVGVTAFLIVWVIFENFIQSNSKFEKLIIKKLREHKLDKDNDLNIFKEFAEMLDIEPTNFLLDVEDYYDKCKDCPHCDKK